MKISIDKNIFLKVPDYKLGVSVISGIDNTGQLTKKAEIGGKVDEVIDAWKKAASKMGIDTVKYPQSNQNLIGRFRETGELPRVNPVVDLTNIFQLRDGSPVGLHDMDKVGGDIEIRPGVEGDTYVPLNKVKAEKVVDPVVYASGNKVLTRNWTWRLSDLGKVDEKSTNVVLFIDTLAPVGYDQVLELLDETAQAVVSAFGGSVDDKAVLTMDSPSVEITRSREGRRETDRIDEFLFRGVENIIPGKGELEKLLRSGVKLNVYNGIDPTSSHIHLGNAVPLRKLQMLVEMGHNVTFLIGDFTALIGDTSDKEAERVALTYEIIEENFQTYKRQAEKVLDFSKVKIVHNSQWLGKLTFEEIVKLCQHFSTGDFVGRELIRKRLSEGKRVGLQELLYPVMQGYDSYHLDTDMQIGGTDQTFNMQAGRTLQKDLRGKESFVLANGFLTGTDGRKMSKSWGNAIWLDDQPDEMFGKAMSVKDDLILEYFLLGTAVEMVKVAEVRTRLLAGENPMNLKKELAWQIVFEMHSKEAADKAKKFFEETFQEGEVPEDAPKVKVGDSMRVADLLGKLVEQGLVKSKSEARRLVEQGGISIVGNKSPLGMDSSIEAGENLKVGKRNFLRLVE